MGIQQSKSYQRAFSLKKQSAANIGIAAASINKLFPMRSFAPSKFNVVRISDRAWYGKGHTWPTFSDIVQQSLQIPASDRSATDMEALYCAAFVMGNLTSIQPNSATNPLEWQHTVKWQSIATYKECLYTSMLEKMGAEYEYQLNGVVLNSFTLRGVRNDHVVLSYEGMARQQSVSAQALPSVTVAHLLKTMYGTVRFGLADTLADISATILEWSLTVSQNPQPLFLMGNTTGEEMLISKILIGDQTASATIRILIDATQRARFLAQNTCEIEINCISPDVINSNKASCKIQIPNCKIADEAFSEEGQTIAYTMTFNEESVLKLGADEHLQLVFLTDVSNTDLLVAG